MLFSTGKRGDIVLIITDAAGRGRNVNHAGLVISVNGDGTYETIEGNTGSGNIANGGMVMNRTRSLSGRGYKIVGFARPSYEKASTVNAPNEIPISAKLTIVGSGIRVRTAPNTSSAVVKNLEEGAVVKATGRIASRHNPWFHIDGGYISGNFVSGWIKDYNDNKRWWYVEKDYKYAKSQWKNIAGKDYCFGKDSYLFVNCYIKSAVNGTYYWVDDDGVYQKRYDTTSPSRKYRIVEDYKNENAL
jgi:SH3 domain protein